LPLRGGASTQTKAYVRGIFLSISGFISPFASLSITSDGDVLRSATADANGRFDIGQIPVWLDFSHFCIDAIDSKRLGESYSCFSFVPTKKDIVMKDILLPPTIGAASTDVTEGSDVYIFGYTMPNATVTIHFNNESFVITADSTGYYRYLLKAIKKGSYTLVADATYNGLVSAMSIKPVIVKVITFVQQTIKIVSSNWLPILISTVVVVLLITFIIYKWHNQLLYLFGLKSNKLHHAWMVGY
jgi:hypothetical protein